MRITFLIPGPGHIPVGGVKIAYEYANHLVRRGHRVTIVHSGSMYAEEAIARRLRLAVGYLYRGLTGRFRPDSWFKLDKAVQLAWRPSFNERNIPDGDVVIATAWQTAEWAANYPERKGRGFYLLQHLELWSGAAQRVYATWRLPLRKIVIARWLQEIAASMGEESVYIPNGLDFNAFHQELQPEDRDPNTVAMLYHHLEWKGSRDGIEALFAVRKRVPHLKAILFGIPPRPRDLPYWFKYHRCASQALLQSIFNEAAVFVAPSRTEGWGLPASEAMMCGAAVAATDVGGHREFAIHGQTALLSPAQQPDRLAGSIACLIEDHQLRYRLARDGVAYVQQFTWERAVDAFENAVAGVPSAPQNAS